MAENAQKFGLEAQVKRNPHPDFKSVESSRPPFEEGASFTYTKTIKPDWTPGSGANNDDWKKHKTVEIDPYGEGRKPVDNYKLLISGIIPRPVPPQIVLRKPRCQLTNESGQIGFVSTISPDGQSTNLGPFSYTALVNHDPPIFCIGFSGGVGNPKDTCRNILETKECTINVISEFFQEAANYTSINAPHGVSEWALSGLTPAKSKKVRPDRVAESVFSIEAVYRAHHEWISPGSGKASGVLVILEGVNFHVREDALNDEGNIIDPAVLQPVSRLGGITYARTTAGFELPRPEFKKEVEREEVKGLVKPKAEGQ
ncbi:hypothetical protein L873DRAFT_1792800 [Choiromyces venosus 120613-1]|uniref:Flavin reductase like domain-containing protein n=1 Tax=Choiromyces venosus 120613-1 TaxID=1336337 RepID=A0A3N4J8W0_9PEZI|nr:hypothetical protein L873DRAFT_1792800 [Choiromyces venosus 120613-1]